MKVEKLTQHVLFNDEYLSLNKTPEGQAEILSERLKPGEYLVVRSVEIAHGKTNDFGIHLRCLKQEGIDTSENGKYEAEIFEDGEWRKLAIFRRDAA